MVTRDQLLFREHAVLRMAERNISVETVLDVINTGAVIEDYPTDTPYPSRLALGFLDARPIHVVWSDAPENIVVVITTYEPNLLKWLPGFRERRKS
jgi:hypothetical protein